MCVSMCVPLGTHSCVCMCSCWGQLRLLYSASAGHPNVGILAHGLLPHTEYGMCDTFRYLYNSQYFRHSI